MCERRPYRCRCRRRINKPNAHFNMYTQYTHIAARIVEDYFNNFAECADVSNDSDSGYLFSTNNSSVFRLWNEKK